MKSWLIATIICWLLMISGALCGLSVAIRDLRATVSALAESNARTTGAVVSQQEILEENADLRENILRAVEGLARLQSEKGE